MPSEYSYAFVMHKQAFEKVTSMGGACVCVCVCMYARHRRSEGKGAGIEIANLRRAEGKASVTV
jgi:hypothetical protein